MSMRQDFEKWCSDVNELNDKHIKFDTSEWRFCAYMDLKTNIAWNAWKAAINGQATKDNNP